MKLEVLLSVMNLNENDLDKMNITSKATIINQCGKEDYKEYINYKIYSYDEKGLSNSRNRGLEHITEDIIVLCDNDMVYNKDYENIIISEFKKNKDADIIIFNINRIGKTIKTNKKERRLHLPDVLNCTSCRIAFKRKSIQRANIRFNMDFGAGAKYSNGEDILFLADALNKKLKIYSSTKNIGTVYHTNSTWFKGYDEKFFYDKGALYTAISKEHRRFLILQYLLRHRELYDNINFKIAFKIAFKGSKDYLKKA